MYYITIVQSISRNVYLNLIFVKFEGQSYKQAMILALVIPIMHVLCAFYLQ